MRSHDEEPADESTHYRIWVYRPGEAPPNDKPVPTTLCPWSRNSSKTLVDAPALVTCRRCRRHIDEIGLK